ncbi:Holo-[acyl-carrier-protein] synthase [Ascochyta rabiei]|uniref:Holo-[acyl-carrier-protein] synthase n=1 Tax=Didymella rabiei TaxID=5454 RepID=A0A162ZIR3_DIDRA|nr:Holo-[acyl-carrier-protein] synthase [Ascochyta rabiei]KZM20622.1 holo-[acyl-carrier-protein] synthase [Ascochyta rabiei]UPX20719.1 Holo-[acyl-carrier-protein] synthase [Ascochyta rabiei]
MPLRPFPFPLRVGTDLCNVSRIRSLITQKPNSAKGPRLKAFLSKILTHPERAYFRGRFGNDESVFRNTDNVARFLAGRFAAKEACRKACDHLGIYTTGFKHIMILPVTTLDHSEHQSQRPQGLILHEALPELEKLEAAKQAAFNVEALDGQLCEISITHDGDFASAVALVPGMK